MEKKVKYLVCPGIVIAKDGDKHYISADQLMSLYHVDWRNCKIVVSSETARGINWEDYIVLRPRTDGDYSKLPSNK